jgi:hypothetical protein
LVLDVCLNPKSPSPCPPKVQLQIGAFTGVRVGTVPHRIHLVALGAIYMCHGYMNRGPEVSNSYAVRLSILNAKIANSW